MANIPSCRFDITGASGSQGLLGPKDSWRAYVLERGGNASQDSTGTLITFDSAAIASRFAVSDWIQAGLLTANIRQVGSVGGNSINVSGAALTVSENMRIFICGVTEPTLMGNSATYYPSTTIRQRGDDSADTYTNSMVTTNSDGLVQFYTAPNMYDVLVQDGNQSNQGYIADLEVGTVEGVSVIDAAYFGVTITIGTSGSILAARGPGGIRYADQFTGADWGVKVGNALADLPAVGGIVDARGLTGTQSIGSTLTISNIGATVLVGPASITQNQGIAITSTANLKMQGFGGTASMMIRGAAYVGTLIDTTSAISGLDISGLAFDNNAGTSTCVQVASGSADVTVHHNHFTNQGSGSAFAIASGGTTLNKRIDFSDNRIESSASTQNIRAVDLSNPGDFMRANRNVIIKTGAISVNQGTAGIDAQSMIEVHSNMFQGVDASNILVRPVSGGTKSMTDVSVCDNKFEDAGLTLGKGFIVVGENAGAAGPPVFRRCVVRGNIGRGYGVGFAGTAISVCGSANGTDGSELIVSDNIIDGRNSSGAVPQGSYGIYLSANCRNASVHDNVIRNTARSGITIEDSAFLTVHDNVIELPVQGSTATSPVPDQMGGIQVQTGVSHCTIHHNRILNPGIAGASSYGIYIRNNSTNNFVTVKDNECIDDRGSTIMVQGISIGATANNVYVARQRSSGGLVVDFLYPITSAGNTIRSHSDIVRLDPNNDYTMTSAPTIPDGLNGQCMILVNVDGGTYTVVLQDQGTLASSNLRLSGNTIGIGPRDSAMVQFDSTVGDWILTSQVNVI